MNSVWLAVIAIVWMTLGYIFYGNFVAKRISPNDKNKTPAITKKDNMDYSPSKKPFLIGHHFASIAGAGPIIGPILAVSYFGWLPTIIWILFGVVFIGAVHDYSTLMASVRNKGKGISNLAKNFLGKRSGWIFGFMLLITLILVLTVFSVSTADSFIQKPELVIPVLGITFLSLILGIVVEKTKINYKLASFIAIVLVFILAWVGFKNPVSLPFASEILVKNIWVTIIFLYAGLASIVPVWLLLRPRGYLSAIQMLLTLALGVIAILIVHPSINAPAYISSSFPLWPILFITVACGAVSGFHGIVSSGTTSKELAKESHGKSVGYGGMLMEAGLAVVVTIVAIAGLSWSSGATNSFQLTLQKGWIVLFSTGFGNIVGQLGIPLITFSFAALLGAFMVNQFIFTSVDSSTRLGRFILSENLFPKLKNRFITTLIVLIPAWLLAITNSYETLWKLFGSANQLIAAISLITVSAYFVSKKKKVKFLIIPSIFVLVTTISALAYLTLSSNGYLHSGNIALAAISLGLIILGIIVAVEGFLRLRK